MTIVVTNTRCVFVSSVKDQCPRKHKQNLFIKSEVLLIELYLNIVFRKGRFLGVFRILNYCSLFLQFEMYGEKS